MYDRRVSYGCWIHDLFGGVLDRGSALCVERLQFIVVLRR